MATNVKQMMEAANAAVPKITAAEAREKIAKGNTLLLDIRDGTEVAGERQGRRRRSRLAGPAGIPRRPGSPTHDKNFAGTRPS